MVVALEVNKWRKVKRVKLAKEPKNARKSGAIKSFNSCLSRPKTANNYANSTSKTINLLISALSNDSSLQFGSRDNVETNEIVVHIILMKIFKGKIKESEPSGWSLRTFNILV